MGRVVRAALLVCTAFVGVTSVAGGLALVLGSLFGDATGVILPGPEYLAGTPFGSYLLPGLVLMIVVSGTQLAALVLLARRSGRALEMTVVAAFGILIWIFVQMVIIPFSLLQLAYFLLGLAELGFVLLGLGLFSRGSESAPTVDSRAANGVPAQKEYLP